MTNITEQDVITQLDKANLKWKNGHRYLVAQCPLHEDRNPSAQIFKNDWFVNCLSNCGRFHVSKAFPELRRNSDRPTYYPQPKPAPKRKIDPLDLTNKSKYDLMYEWLNLPFIRDIEEFKGIPVDVLEVLGWRFTDGELGLGVGYFIPYWDVNKDTIPFAQVRHLKGERRFTFLPNAEPTLYGTWNLAKRTRQIMIVEGASDCVTLEYLGIPWIGVPSSSSTKLVEQLGVFANAHDLYLIYGGDNDEAGDKLRYALDNVAHYRVHQPPKEYNDWNEYFNAVGYDEAQQYAMEVF